MKELKSMNPTLDILYHDPHYIAVHKPPGIHVHPSELARQEDSCMRILRDQLGQWVYPVHRLDRATSGVLLFALDSEAAGKMIGLFLERQVRKRYLAVVRGYTDAEGLIDHPLREAEGQPAQEAQTAYRRLGTVELPYPMGKFPTVRYSLVEAFPHTGRRNQIRRHFVHISHPIVGDVRFGDGRHNRLFREKFGLHRLLLLATDLEFIHPYSGEEVSIHAPVPGEVKGVLGWLGWGDGW